MKNIVAKNLDRAGDSWTFLDGSKRSVVILESVAVGRGEYLPGWRWSEHVGRQTGKTSETHIGYIISGKMITRTAEGQEVAIGPGDAFELPPKSDAWVVGDGPCVALDFANLKV